MKENSIKRNRLLTICMLALLFASYWVFCRFENGLDGSAALAAEYVFFFVMYSLSLFNIPLIIPFVLLVLGTVGSSVFYAKTIGVNDGEFIIPACWFFALLFYIEQLCFIRGRGETVFAMILTYASRTLPFALAGGFVYYLDKRIESYYLFIFSIVLSVIVSIVYIVFALAKKEAQKSKKKKKKQSAPDTKQMRISFALAVVPVLAGEAYLVLNRLNAEGLVYLLPMLWLINIVMLYGQGHPLVCGFFGKKPENTQE